MKNFRILFFIGIAAMFAFTLACGGSQNTSNSNGAIKTGVKPIADDEIAIIEMENSAAFGKIELELYSNIAPKAVARFKELANEGFYNGTTFHRVNEHVIQGGDPNSKDNDPTNDGTGGSDKPDVPAEFSDIPFDTGILGAARSQDINSANSQFFITLHRVPDFDKRYTIFGKVINGMNNVRTIAGVQPKERERPVEDVKIKSITIVKR